MFGMARTPNRSTVWAYAQENHAFRNTDEWTVSSAQHERVEEWERFQAKKRRSESRRNRLLVLSHEDSTKTAPQRGRILQLDHQQTGLAIGVRSLSC